jgi:plasmid stability protein
MKHRAITLDEDLLRDLEKRAAGESVSVQALVNQLLRTALRSAPRRPYRLVLKGWRATPLPGVDLLTRTKEP